MIRPAPGCHDATVESNLSAGLDDPCYSEVRRETSCCPHIAVHKQAEVALRLAASPEQLVFGICKHSLSIRRRQSVMSNRRQLALSSGALCIMSCALFSRGFLFGPTIP